MKKSRVFCENIEKSVLEHRLGKETRVKHLSVAFAVSLLLCLASMYVNYQSYQETHYLAWSYRIHGGEITMEFAPGWHAVHIYAMRPEEHDSHKLAFSPVVLAVSLLAFTLLGYVVLAKFSVGAPWKDFLLLFVGFTVLFFGGRAILELWEEYR